MNDILNRYGELLNEVDNWFDNCLRLYPKHINCGNGCSHCCRGLFDITLLDAMYLKRGFDQLSPDEKARLSAQALKRLENLTGLNSKFVSPWLLNTIDESEWDLLMPEEDETSCVLLDMNGSCLLYKYRPMTCRLNGIPLIDVSGEEFFDEWCTLNFTDLNPEKLIEIRHSFHDIFSDELLLFQEMMCRLTGRVCNEADLFIPAAIVMDLDKISEAVKQFNKSS